MLRKPNAARFSLGKYQSRMHLGRPARYGAMGVVEPAARWVEVALPFFVGLPGMTCYRHRLVSGVAGFRRCLNFDSNQRMPIAATESDNQQPNQRDDDEWKHTIGTCGNLGSLCGSKQVAHLRTAFAHRICAPHLLSPPTCNAKRCAGHHRSVDR